MLRLSACILVFLFSFQLSIAKSVDENTAKIVGSNFCKTQGASFTSAELTTAYKATSSIGANNVTDFFVFNTGNKGFVIVAADDNVVPVLAYSDESSFNAAHIPGNVDEWLNNYASQINYVVEHNITASADIQKQWVDLMQTPVAAHSKTTGVVYPLMKTYWNQRPNYNFLCPMDFSQSANALTGCVATAMAQVMRYWSWPKKGVGVHSYYDGTYGRLSADFGSTIYHWDSMPVVIGYDNYAVGLINLHAGISVDMNYGVNASGAYVVKPYSPVTNCAEYALTEYFSYKRTLSGLLRNAYSDSDWVHIIKAELDAKRPVIHTGSGNAGGHCFVFDGYITYNRFHVNWGWGGSANGYYIVEALSPGNTTFNDNQTMIVGIEPDSTFVAGINEVAATKTFTIYPDPASTEVFIDLNGINATDLSIVSADGRVVHHYAIARNELTAKRDVSSLASGVYFIRVTTDKGIISNRVVISR